MYSLGKEQRIIRLPYEVNSCRTSVFPVNPLVCCTKPSGDETDRLTDIPEMDGEAEQPMAPVSLPKFSRETKSRMVKVGAIISLWLWDVPSTLVHYILWSKIVNDGR